MEFDSITFNAVSRRAHEALRVRELLGCHVSRQVSPLREIIPRYEAVKAVLAHEFAIYTVLFDETGRYFYTGSDDTIIKKWDARTLRLLSTFRGHKEEVVDMDISNDGNTIYSVSYDKCLRVWETTTGRMFGVYPGHKRGIDSMGMSKNPEFPCVVTASSDGTCRVYDPAVPDSVRDGDGECITSRDLS